MKRKLAPEGQMTRVEATVTLENGQSCQYGWTTPMGVKGAAAKALEWAQHEMKASGVRGRGAIAAVRIAVSTQAGRYEDRKGSEVEP